MSSFGMSRKNIAGVLGAPAKLAAATENLARKAGVEDPEIMASTLLTKVDMYIVQLADRLLKPDASVILGLFGKGGKPAVGCLAALTTLPHVLYHRANLRDIPISPEVNSAIEIFTNKLSVNKSAPTSRLDYAKYSIQPTDDSLVNLLIAMSELITTINENANCKAARRIVNFAENTTSLPGKDPLGTKTFNEDVRKLFKFVIDTQDLLAQAAVFARLQKEEDAATKARYNALLTRLRALRSLSEVPSSLESLQERFARLKGNDGSAAGAGGGGGRMGGGYRKARRGRKTRRNQKVRRTTKTKSRKNNRHQ